jgi:hypothetical protein
MQRLYKKVAWRKKREKLRVLASCALELGRIIFRHRKRKRKTLASFLRQNAEC